MRNYLIAAVIFLALVFPAQAALKGVSGIASLAVALVSNGANCSAGSAPLGVDASGASESCFDVWTEAENTSAAYQTTAAAANNKKRTIGFSTTSPTTGQQGSYVVTPCAGTITAWNIVADAGTATVKAWKIAAGTTAPTIANVINTSGVSLSSGTAVRSTTLSDFTTTTVTANDIWAFDMTAVATATKLLFALEITCS